MKNYYEVVAKGFAATPFGSWLFISCSAFDKRLIKWTRGKLSLASGTTMHRHGVLLYVIGAKTGLERCVPLTAAFRGEEVILVGSRGGHEHNPHWYHNLVSNPACAVEHKGKRREMVAREASDEERDSLWQMVLDVYEGYGAYQSRTKRKLPIMVLTPTPS